ncbi:MAG: hypothetical protein ACTTH7_10025 [Treponema sp.]
MKKIGTVFVLLWLFCTFLCAEETLTHVRPKTAGLDIELSQIAVTIMLFDGESIAYRYELQHGSGLSVTETHKTLRIRQLFPAEGKLFIFIPQKMVLESCLIRLNRAQLYVEGIRVAHFLTMMNSGGATLSDTLFKNAVINLAQGTLTVKSRVLNSCAITITDTTADVVLQDKPDHIHVDYSKTNSSIFINTDEQLLVSGQYGNPKGKTRLILSAASSKAVIQFKPNEPETPKKAQSQ